MATATVDRTAIRGQVTPGFEAVRDAFADNFVRRHELGGACCAYHQGEKHRSGLKALVAEWTTTVVSRSQVDADHAASDDGAFQRPSGTRLDGTNQGARMPTLS